MEFVLIHAPLVGPYTWVLVAEELNRMGFSTVLPTLPSPPDSKVPYWQLHAHAVAESVHSTARRLVLVAHSGAGPLLPAVRAALSQEIAGYIFVDAGLPEDGKSRLDQFESAEEVEQFLQSAQDGLLPPWTADDLREVIPDDAVRARFAGELRPLPVQVYQEPLPVFPGWPDAPVGYLRFGHNPAYEAASRRARSEHFTFMQMEGEHFHMLVNPALVTRALVELSRQMGAL